MPADTASKTDTQHKEASAMRMDAYYYGFNPTGVQAIDRILSAVACAGKAFHHTEDWTDEADPSWYGDHLRGATPAEWIENAAKDAAPTLSAALEEARAENARLREALVQARGALRLDAMVDDEGKPFGTTQVALDAIDAALKTESDNA